jgi:hypothetical protein
VVVAPPTLTARLRTVSTPDRRIVVLGAPAVAPRLLDLVTTTLAEARRHALAFEYAEALEAIRRAQVMLESGAAEPEDWDALHDTLADRALVETNLGRPGAARDALRAAACMRPHRQLDEVRFPPDLQAEYRQVAEEVRAAPPAVVTVTAEPASAMVELDGASLGRAPVTARGCAGRHYLRISALGFSPRVLSLDLSNSTGGPIHVALPRARRQELAGQLLSLEERALLRRRQEVLSLLGAQAVIRVLPAERGTVPLIGLGASGVRPLRRSARPADLPRAVRSLATDLGGPTSRAAPSAGVTSSPWFWVTAGALLTMGGVSTFLLLDRKPDPVLRVSTD